ncbi:unnamed protein product, partial [Polarella glacialis]
SWSRSRSRDRPPPPPVEPPLRSTAGSRTTGGVVTAGGPQPDEANLAGQNSNLDELDSWLRSLDSDGGSLMRYSAALHGEFTSLSEIAAAIVDQNAQGLACVEPSVFEALGIKMLGHKLLLSKGIVALASRPDLRLM